MTEGSCADGRDGPGPGTTRVLVLDPSVRHTEMLLAGAAGECEIVRLASQGGALEQIADRLAGRAGIASFHVLCHGEPGALLLAGERIDGGTLAARPGALERIARALAVDAEVVLYGCSVAAGRVGRAFLELMAAGLGAAVAAADGPVGAATLGGDWRIARRDGATVEPMFAPGARAAYPGVLAIATLTTGADAPVLSAGDDTVIVDVAGALNAADAIDGLGGTDTLAISAAQTVVLGAATLLNVETIVITGGAQDIRIADATVAAGRTLTVNASASDAALIWGGGDETDGNSSVLASAFDDTLLGGEGDDVLLGSAGDDVVLGSGGQDTLSGGAGNDVLLSNDSVEGGQILDGGDGDDLLTGKGAPSLFRGGVGADTVSSAGGSDTISGGAGADILSGGGEQDVLSGGDGADVLSGGAGHDALSGGSGADTLVGGTGNDTYGGTAAELDGDTISGFAAGDRIVVVGTDLSALHGTAAAGTIDLGSGWTLTLDGVTGALGSFAGSFTDGKTTLVVTTLPLLTAGSDTPASTAGDDAIAAGAANTLNAADSIDGGGGADTLELMASQTVTLGATTLVDYETISISGGIQNITTSDGTVASGAVLTVDGVNSFDSITWNGAAETDGRFYIRGGEANDSLTGGLGNDTIDGGAGVNVVSGGGGDDQLRSGGGSATLYGGEGNDVLSNLDSVVGTDVLDGGNGDDSLVAGSYGVTLLRGGAGNDSITSTEAADTLSGGAGDDLLRSSTGADLLFGGDGNDTFTGGGGGHDGDTISGFSVGDAIVVTGADLSSLNGTAAAGTVAVGSGQTLTLAGISSASGTLAATFSGGDTTITLTAPSGGGGGGGSSGSSDDSTVTGTDTDTGSGSGSGSAGVTTTVAPSLISTAVSPATSVTPPAGVTVNASTLADGAATGSAMTQANAQIGQLVADPSAESSMLAALNTFAGTRIAGATLDVVTLTPTAGGSAAAPIVVTGATGANAGSQEVLLFDLSAFSGSGSFAYLRLDHAEFVSLIGNAVVTGGAGANYVVGDGGVQSILLGAGNDTALGGAGNDSLTGAAGDDVVSGGDGVDLIRGGFDHDVAYGNQGADAVYGNQGRDTVFGGQGGDSVFGGQHQDVVYGNFGDDVVYGNLAADTLFGGQGNDALYGGQSNEGVDVLVGGAGADTLGGGLGADSLSGGSGGDVFLIAGSGGSDTIIDFNGAEGDLLVLAANANGTGIDSFAELRAAAVDTTDGAVEIDLGTGNSVRLVGVSVAQLQAGWFAFS